MFSHISYLDITTYTEYYQLGTVIALSLRMQVYVRGRDEEV